MKNKHKTLCQHNGRTIIELIVMVSKFKKKIIVRAQNDTDCG